MEDKDRRIRELEDQLARANEIIVELRSMIVVLRTQITEQQERLQELEARLGRDSNNSNKPPSSDAPWSKPKSRRKSTGAKPGGQISHPGRTLKQVTAPDHIVEHTPVACTGCGTDLNEAESVRYEKRQVFDIPEPKLEITEHRAALKVCPSCGSYNKAAFPKAINSATQYGQRIRMIATYLWGQHYFPYERLAEALSALFSAKISPGTLFSLFPRVDTQLPPFLESAKRGLIAAPCVNFDETGLRISKRLHWLHSASTAKIALFHPHFKRGQEAMNAMGILPVYTGTAMHDGWKPYAKYNCCSHGLCNGHHLRELEGIEEHYEEKWAGKMQKLLLRAHQEAETHKEGLPGFLLEKLVNEYRLIIAQGKEYHASLSPLPRGKRGRQKQRPGKNLLDRLEKEEASTLRFLRDSAVPFTNNEAERDIRMMKLKQKISGCFRTSAGAMVFCRIRSYLATARKQRWDPLDALKLAMQGHPKLVPILGS